MKTAVATSVSAGSGNRAVSTVTAHVVQSTLDGSPEKTLASVTCGNSVVEVRTGAVTAHHAKSADGRLFID